MADRTPIIQGLPFEDVFMDENVTITETKTPTKVETADKGTMTDDMSTIDNMTAVDGTAVVKGQATMDDKPAVDDETTTKHKSPDDGHMTLKKATEVNKIKLAIKPKDSVLQGVIDQLVSVMDMNMFATTLIHNDPDADIRGQVPVANYLVSDVRVASPHPPAVPLIHQFIGIELSPKLMQHVRVIEYLIRKDMGEATFDLNIVMLVTDPIIRHPIRRPTVLVHAEQNSNLVPGDLWGPDTDYRGSRWLYIVDKVRAYLQWSGLADVAVEFREKGFQDDEITAFEQPGLVLDIDQYRDFNQEEGIMYQVIDHLTDYNENITPWLESVKVYWVCWPHNRLWGDFPAMVFKFRHEFDEFYWPPLAQTVRNILDNMGEAWVDLPILFRWDGQDRLGW
ncbi:hypothetical protein F4805DRAFT_454969 [Annulohypoxylon moriforme]|nr:hypothetical protein F4805DRAFT_454969 [Annulohypoxylon moriforme]